MSRVTHPLASLRLATAIRYWHAARIVMSQQSAPVQFMEPVGLLIGMAMELGLKAFLQQAGLAEKEILSRDLGHNLDVLLRHAIKQGLEVSAEEAQAILLLSVAHREHFYRYGPANFQPELYAILLCDENAALAMSAKLLDRISENPELLRVPYAANAIIWPETLPVFLPVTLEQLKNMQAVVAERAEKVAALGAPHRKRT
jgi:hypothetical protein